MNKGSQRQEILFLGLAVAVLFVVVGLIGVRSYLAKRTPKAQASAKPAPAVRAKPLAPAGAPVRVGPPRDPFGARPATAPTTTQTGGRPPGAAPSGRAESGLRLVGVMSGATPMAVIHEGDRRFYVRAGDKVEGYTVSRIAEKRVLLVRGEEHLTLELNTESASRGRVISGGRVWPRKANSR